MAKRQMKALENFIQKIILDMIECEKKFMLENGGDLNNFKGTLPDITFWQEDRLFISAECSYSQTCVADYYGEFRGGYPWINEKIEKRAGELGLFIEWQNPGCLAVYEA